MKTTIFVGPSSIREKMGRVMLEFQNNDWQTEEAATIDAAVAYITKSTASQTVIIVLEDSTDYIRQIKQNTVAQKTNIICLHVPGTRHLRISKNIHLVDSDISPHQMERTAQDIISEKMPDTKTETIILKRRGSIFKKIIVYQQKPAANNRQIIALRGLGYTIVVTNELEKALSRSHMPSAFGIIVNDLDGSLVHIVSDLGESPVPVIYWDVSEKRLHYPFPNQTERGTKVRTDDLINALNREILVNG